MTQIIYSRRNESRRNEPNSKSARKAKDMLYKACERASEICEQTLHRQEQNTMRMASMRESPGSDQF